LRPKPFKSWLFLLRALYFWGQIGIFLSSWIKIGLILFFGVLCVAAKKFAMPNEWIFARKILLGSLIVRVAFYIFVVTWNAILFVSFARAPIFAVPEGNRPT